MPCCMLVSESDDDILLFLKNALIFCLELTRVSLRTSWGYMMV